MKRTDDTFRLFVPLEKSVEVDGQGDYIVQGVISSDDEDLQGDTITPDGMDTSYFLEKGWIKWEHGNSPNQFIGEPMDVQIGQYMHPTLKKSVNGVFVKARLFANRDLAMQAVVAIEDLQKSQSSRSVGWSIEGGVIERCRETGKILKSVLRNVVLTMNPVNTTSYAELVKSFTQGDEENMTVNNQDQGNTAELTMQLSGLEKSMTQIIKQNVEVLELAKSLSTENATLKTEMEELRKSFNQPQMRKSVTSNTQTIARPKDGEELTQKEIMNELNKSFDAGNLSGTEVIRYETGTPLEQLNLPAELKEKFGV
ncbi:hypothetical protein [Paenibacillus nuruki]|uniref:hypothetical protein n=1 Tax=Paenibacillus nuruki TaxID=1886670 RepID=UPI002805BDAD|nr:hypothetical protein [Paenibacillus nuruki]CAJ1315923.1 Prohead protease [Paenibacillus nuruki]